ncbi:hypothetical protein BSKO_12702 [Bryopsis sp. KO-2023]|nr:hypothetical protein BSKO_12702 [Bryopsis sp. KO-2023]
MFRNQYDTDILWSPQGRIHQVEYAMEAVKQGSCAVGLTSEDHVVLATLKRSQSELSSYQRKVFKIDDHLGIAISGLTADGRILCKYMRNECINYRYVYESAMPVGRLVRQVADKSQKCTQYSWKRPYGVGLLVAGFDKAGPHLFHTCPSGNFYEYRAFAIGLRSQASRTYLEKKYEEFKGSSVEELIQHGLKSLESSIQDGELDTNNCSIAVVGKDMPLTVIEGDDLLPHIELLKNADAGVEAGGQEADAPGEAAAGGGGGGGEQGDVEMAEG